MTAPLDQLGLFASHAPACAAACTRWCIQPAGTEMNNSPGMLSGETRAKAGFANDL